MPAEGTENPNRTGEFPATRLGRYVIRNPVPPGTTAKFPIQAPVDVGVDGLKICAMPVELIGPVLICVAIPAGSWTLALDPLLLLVDPVPLPVDPELLPVDPLEPSPEVEPEAVEVPEAPVTVTVRVPVV